MGRIEKGAAIARRKKTSEDSSEEAKKDSTVVELGEPVTNGAATTIADIADVEALDIGSLRKAKLDSKVLRASRIVIDHDSPASTPYKMLRTRVLQRMQRNGWGTIAISGTCPDEGKTLTAINLSLSIAREMSTSVVLRDHRVRQDYS